MKTKEVKDWIGDALEEVDEVLYEMRLHDYAPKQVIEAIKDVDKSLRNLLEEIVFWEREGAGTPEKGARRALDASEGYDVMARVLLGTREAAGGALQPVYDILRDYIDRALGHLKREGLTVGIEDSELDLVVYVHGVDADSSRQAGELVFNQLKRDRAMVVAEVQPQV